jgi:hypothetical protein
MHTGIKEKKKKMRGLLYLYRYFPRGKQKRRKVERSLKMESL